MYASSWATVLGLCVALLAGQTAVCASPSVVLVVADDMGWGDLSLHGNTNLSTPNLDRLAQESARFERFYVQPVCSPTRAELLTGRYATRVGVTGVSRGEERLDPSGTTIAEVLRNAGYRTAAFGKWHNGAQPPYHPLCRGFDHFYGFTSGHWASYFDPLLDLDGELTTGKGFLPDDLTDHTIRFIEQSDGEPFFALLAYNTPHSPMQVPDEWWDRHDGQVLKLRGTQSEREDVLHTRAALAMVENLDWNVGRLMGALDRLDRAEDTVLIFLSDNGPNGHRYNQGLRGVKGSTDEGGVRSPLFVRWRGAIVPRVITTPTAAIDLAPTIASLTGAAFQGAGDHDGQSLEPLLVDEAGVLPERILFTTWNGSVAARRGDFVLDSQGRLYNHANDPGQTSELSGDYDEQKKQLEAQVAAYRREVLRASRADDLPFTVGGEGPALTQLPARDATASGGVVRSNRYPNASYFTNWTTTEGAIAWPAEILSAGSYRATVYYTCPASEVGSLVELSFEANGRTSSASARVETAHDPPLTASRRDRFPRAESDMKRFAPMVLGVIELPRGVGSLRLRAVEVPGAQVMDFRMLTLRRL